MLHYSLISIVGRPVLTPATAVHVNRGISLLPLLAKVQFNVATERLNQLILSVSSVSEQPVLQPSCAHAV